MGQEPIGPDVTPEQFAELIRGATDEQIQTQIRELGVADTLERTFEGMQQAFLPERAKGVDAVVQWVVTDDGDEHPYRLTVRDGACSIEGGLADSPRVTLTTDLVSFMRLIAGQATGPALFMSGKLRVGGDLMFSQQVSGFFQPVS